MEVNKIICGDWYNQLLTDLKRLAFEGIVKTKHAIGKRILEDEVKFGKPEYGKKKIEGLAKELDISWRDLYYCIQFARKYPEIATALQNVSWRHIVQKLLPEPQNKPETPPLPKGIYDVIYADPPWEYKNTGFDSAACKQYSTMPTSEICELEFGIAENAILFLWVTNPLIPDGLNVMNTWGFDYKTNFCWFKEGSHLAGFYVYGQHELLFIGVKGTKLLEGQKFESVIKRPSTKHSQKPNVVYEMIEKMYPKGKYLELFARKKHSTKWTVWGLEV